MKEEFAVADRYHRLNYDEFASPLQGLEAGMFDQELRIGFREIDTDTDGFIDFQEFVDWWTVD